MSLIIVVLAMLGTGLSLMVAISSLHRLGPADVMSIPRAQAQLQFERPGRPGGGGTGVGPDRTGGRRHRAGLALLPEDRHARGRRGSGVGVRGIGSAQDDVLSAIVVALRHSDGEVRRYAAYALSGLGPSAVSAIPELTRALADQHMAYMAARALGEIGPAARGAIPQLTALLSHPEPADRAEAARAGEPHAVAARNRVSSRKTPRRPRSLRPRVGAEVPPV